jgi:hypothetical protein
MYSITFETKCYENDWEYLLKTKYMDKMIQNCNIEFAFKQIIINNVKDKNKVKFYAQKKMDEGIINAYYFVDDYIDEALNFFNITKESFGIGYYYSSAELVGLYLSKHTFHLHFSSDAFMPQNLNSTWILEASNLLEGHPEYVVANPTWYFQFDNARLEAQEKCVGNFYVGKGFSDQCYLVRTEDFKKNIYSYHHPDSARYPAYGGELFEKRVDAFMRTKGLLRLTSTKESYIHYNFPKTKVKKFITFLLIKINLYYPIAINHYTGSIVRRLARKYIKPVVQKMQHRLG